MNEWIEWNGGDCPIDEGTVIDIKTRKRGISTRVHAGRPEWEPDSKGPCCAVRWEHEGLGTDIIAYRLSEAS